MKKQYDVAIIGGGIVGLSIARFLSRYQLSILVVEKEKNLCAGASGANSATIHTGHSVLPATLKAEMNTRGNRLWDSFAVELDIPFERRGDLVVAFTPDELVYLEKLLKQGQANGVSELSILSHDELLTREPNVNPLAVGALWSPNTGICDPYFTVLAVAEHAVQNEVLIELDMKFERFIIGGDNACGIVTNRGTFNSRWTINAAGVYADDIAHLASDRLDFKIQPRHGEYIVLDGNSLSLRNLLSPVPSATTKGIGVKPTLYGEILVGANARSITDKEAIVNTKQGLAEVWEGARKLVPALDTRHIKAVFTGLRATGNAFSDNATIDYCGDFVIEASRSLRGLIHVAGIESPGLTAAPAIAERVVDLLTNGGETFREKLVWTAVRKTGTQGAGSALHQQAAELRKARYVTGFQELKTATIGGK